MKQSTQFKVFEKFVKKLQNKICNALEELDENKFIEDRWFRPEGGGGITRVMQLKSPFVATSIFEKAAVNFSNVTGPITSGMVKAVEMKGDEFSACGCSLIIHPTLPKVPTTHMNVRYFETNAGQSWYGGGIDLTPFYPFPEDFVFFHKTLAKACNSAIPNSYAPFKTWCDEYFTIKHRNEMRGIGGVFFDYLDGADKANFKLTKSVGNAFLKAYLPIVENRSKESHTNFDIEFMKIRRGRYIEFNLVYDRGTLFGLKSNARAESILCSMPPDATFTYNWTPKMGSPQEQMMQYYQPKDWLTFDL
jgi:coproporphyrinogen III oxidase